MKWGQWTRKYSQCLFNKPNSEIQPLHCSPKRTIEIKSATNLPEKGDRVVLVAVQLIVETPGDLVETWGRYNFKTQGVTLLCVI